MVTQTRLLAPLLLMISAGVGGCATTGSAEPDSANDNLDAVLWLQGSTAYAAVTTGLFANAVARLEAIARTEPDWTRSMAIVMDIDETVLDNSRYQGQLVFDNAEYSSESWDQWLALRAAEAVPGAIDFIRISQSLGFHVAFITNRRCRARPDSTDDCPQIEDTLANLRVLGIDTQMTTLYIRGDQPPAECRAFLTAAERDGGTWSSDKTSRRECVALDHEIVMLFGDQLGDFTEDASGATGRERAAAYADKWGRTWFMLPNPTYGDWRPREPAEKRELIRGIDSR